jgi:hypothetical protein
MRRELVVVSAFSVIAIGGHHHLKDLELAFYPSPSELEAVLVPFRQIFLSHFHLSHS